MPDYLALNPNGGVPTFVDEGMAIVELSVICEYLDEKFSHNPLVPSDIVERARMRAWMHYIEEVAVGAIRVPSFNRRSSTASKDKIRSSSRPGDRAAPGAQGTISADGSPRGFSKAAIDKSLGELSETCRRMDEAIAKKGPWLMGEQFTLADVLVMPSIDRMADLGLSTIWERNIRASANGMSSCKRDRLPGDLFSRLAGVGFSAAATALRRRRGHEG